MVVILNSGWDVWREFLLMIFYIRELNNEMVSVEEMKNLCWK